MITAELAGGLGNQMFQIAAATSLAINNNDEACFDLDGHRIGLQGNNASIYKENIYLNVKNGIINPNKIYDEPGFNYKQIPYSENLKIKGYFQSEKYFEKNKNKIIELFSPNKDVIDKLKKTFNIFSTETEKLVSLHIRLGDYLYFPNIHPFIGLKYIIEALTHFKGYRVLIFSDDIDWCLNNYGQFKTDDNSFSFIKQEGVDYYDMYLMSLCDSNILSNSSFSWWGAYLNRNENKKIIAPKNWFGPGFGQDFSDIYTENMIII